jgi:beta-glucosidase-like glycosyl hydrolase/CubicO group peptidase (beta-lactamase class C family)
MVKRMWPVTLALLSFGWGPAQYTESNPYEQRNYGAWIAQATVEDLAGQMIMVAGYSRQGESHIQQLSAWAEAGQIGGIIWMQGGPGRQRHAIERTQAAAMHGTGIPLLNAQDAEWGASMRLDSLERLPWPLTLGATRQPDLARAYGQSLGQESRALGIHVNFSPVVDVNTNPANPIIGQRSLGSDVGDVNRMATSELWGLQSQGVMACAKHFPGHGDTDSDSHKTLPTLNHSLQTLRNREMRPFENSIRSGVGAIMVAHLNIPALDPTGTPASISKPIVTHWLRDSLHFEGLIFTDALNMKGLAQDLTPGEIEIQAIEAGNDVLLFVADPKAAVKAIARAVESGRLTRAELEAHVGRILAAKARYVPEGGAIPNREDAPLPSRKGLNTAIYRAAATLVYDPDSMVSRTSRSSLVEDPFYVVAMGESVPAGLVGFDAPAKVDAGLASYFKDSRGFTLPRIWIFHMGSSANPWKSARLPKSVIEQAKAWKARGVQVGLVHLGNPYGLRTFSDGSLLPPALITETFDALILGYENVPEVVEAIQAAIESFSPQGLPGRIPVSGLHFNPEMPRATLGEAGFQPDLIKNIDAIVEEGLRKGAYPGCQVFLARHGKVVLNGVWGTLDGTNSVEPTDRYDLASVTKILASVPLIMDFAEATGGTASLLGTPIAEFLPELGASPVGDLEMGDILSHQSGLPAWIPFYQDYLWKDGNLDNRYFRTTKSDAFPNEVAPSVFSRRDIRDSVIATIAAANLGPKKYKYSDLGYYLHQRWLERYHGAPMDEVLETNWYAPMGIHLQYNPLQKAVYSGDGSAAILHLAPTENDQTFRRQLLRGTVHDQGAALLGGVAGHAGLFGSAQDVAAMMQFFLQGGRWNGYQYLEPQTIQAFSSCYACDSGNRRGLGFDRPQTSGPGPTCGCVSPLSFGHTGFTGTFAWADPETGIVLVFLSNRVYPDANNPLLGQLDIRTRIQEAVQVALVD